MTRTTTCRIAAVALILFAIIGLGLQLNRTQLWEDRQVYAGWRVQQHVILSACRLVDRDNVTRTRGWQDDCTLALELERERGGLAPGGRHLVLMLHGMGRSTFVFNDMQRALCTAGYEAVAISYPSLTRDIAGHADQVEALLNQAQNVERVSFVTHSLGGLVVRETLSREAPWRARLALGRVVMLAPPNQGSALAESLRAVPAYGWVGGPSAREIAAGPPFADLPEGVEVAVVAGGTGKEGFNPLLAGDDDGIVTVAETELAGVQDHLVVNALHTVIAAAPESIAATLNFLDHGWLR